MDELERHIARLESMATAPEDQENARAALKELRTGAECMRLSEQNALDALAALKHAHNLRNQSQENLKRAAEHLRRVHALLDAVGLGDEE